MAKAFKGIPKTEFSNLLHADPTGPLFWRKWLGEDRYEELLPHFEKMGEVGAMAAPLSDRADKQGPVLRTHNRYGERVDEVEYHPDYRELERLSYGNGIVAIKYEREFLARHRSYRHLTGFGAGYYFAQTELGLYCPICMTDGVGRVLEKHAPDHPMAAKTIARIASRDLDSLWQGAMFLTEAQGGSDVGANTVQASPDPGSEAGDPESTWLLNGDKWFCSNVDAEAALVLARMPGGAPGTKGLGLFLVLREHPADNARTIRVHRLKEKLGVRAMASGEVTFENTRAYLIGGDGAGFKQMAEMLNLSRIYNAVTSVAGARRAILEALAYGSARQAFGKRLWDLPLWRAGMADLVAEQLGMFLFVFEAVRSLDAADGGDEAAGKLVRILTPIAKALTGKFSVWAVSESMEAIGGNAYIEESILPRLLRDCQVLPIWEGTTNILSLDMLRAASREGALAAFTGRVSAALSAASKVPGAADLVARASQAASRLAQSASGLTNGADENVQRQARYWMEEAGRTLSLALLLESAAEPALRETCLAAAARLLNRPAATQPLGWGDVAGLGATEEPLLNAAYRA